MSHRYSALIDDPEDGFFPEIENGRSLYSSPLADILGELLRKHVLAAAATSGPSISLNDSVDKKEEKGLQTTDSCTCQARLDLGTGSSRTRRSSSLFGGASFGREESIANLTSMVPKMSGVCPVCGKKKPFDPIGELLHSSARKQKHYRRVEGTSRVGSGLGPPNHTEALLQTTPHLRHLSPASLDMQGTGNMASSRGIFGFVLPAAKPAPSGSSINALEPGQILDYRTCLARDQANRKMASDLASFLWVLSHEMSLEDYLAVEREVFTSVFALVHAHDSARRMAGVAALDALMDAPSADEEKKAIKFYGALSSGLRAPHADYNFLAALSGAVGHLATRATNVDTVEAEASRALEWLRLERSDRRLAACLTLKQLAINAPTAFYTKSSAPRSPETSLGYEGSNEFMENIIPVVRDPQPIVRACAADALSQCLKILVARMQPSLTGYLLKLHSTTMEGLEYDFSKKRVQSLQATQKTEVVQHGSLLVVACMLEYADEFMQPRFDQVCAAVLKFTQHPKAVILLEVIRLIPRLARMAPDMFGRRIYLEDSLAFLMKCAANPPPPRVGVDVRPAAYASLGHLILTLRDPTTGIVIGAENSPTIQIMTKPDSPEMEPSLFIETRQVGIVYEKLGDIFGLVRLGLRRTKPGSSSRGAGSDTRSSALNCGADLVEALGRTADPYIPSLIDDIFGSGLSEELIHCLHSIAVCVPPQQAAIEDRLLQEVSLCLAGMREAVAICDPLLSFLPAVSVADACTSVVEESRDSAESDSEIPRVVINSSQRPDVVKRLVLSLFTLGSFGDSQGMVTTSGTVVSLLPFVQHVASHYLSHGSDVVRRAAALTCCARLVPPDNDTLVPSASGRSKGLVRLLETKIHAGTASNHVIEAVLRKLLQVAVSDPSPVVRLCVIRGLDSRYDVFLSQTHHVQAIFMLIEDEAVAARAAGIKLLGRLSKLNPAPVLPVVRRFLVDLMVEMRCGGDKRSGREDATRLLDVLLRAEPFQRLVQPVLPSIIGSLPLTAAAPRLASAALEALGELAQASRSGLAPWINELVPHILETMQDQSSVTKQLISLKTLGHISGSTGYVITPYLDYPQLLSQAADVLPGTKRAPWALRREVIRTLGILGALDPDQYHAFVPAVRKGGAVGGAYFLEQNDSFSVEEKQTVSTRTVARRPSTAGSFFDELDLPAHNHMYGLCAMAAQPVVNILPDRRISPADEEFYPTVAIQALTRIFRDPSLAVHHGPVLQAIMFIFQSLGLHCVPYLKKMVPYMIYTVRTCGPSTLREALFKHLATLSSVVNEHLRPYVADIFDALDDFWSSRHLGAVLDLISKIAVGVPDEFSEYVPRLVQKLLATLAEIQSSDWLMPFSRNEVPGSASVEVEKLGLILRSLRNFKGVLGSYLHVLVPALLQLGDTLVAPSSTAPGGNGVTPSTLSDVAVLTFETLAALLAHDSSTSSTRVSSSLPAQNPSSFTSGASLAARAAQPLIRLLGKESNANRVVGQGIVKAICVCAMQLGYRRWKALYFEVAKKAIREWQERMGSSDSRESPSADRRWNSAPMNPLPENDLHLYVDVVRSLELASEHLSEAPSGLVDPSVFISRSLARQNSLLRSRDPSERLRGVEGPSIFNDTSVDPGDPSLAPQLVKEKVNQGILQRAWDVSRHVSREDWDEWMRRFAIELLREAPSPALRATASLAHAYQPLARELFSAAFVCCWGDLDQQYRDNLIYSLETAFAADVSPEILQTLLNLAEFMEHEGIENGLPIHTSILAELALKCRAYAKALHYKEREYNQGDASGSCVEALISINSKLDLPEAGMGVLKAARIRHARSRLECANSIFSTHEPRSFTNQQSSHFLRHFQTFDMLYSVLATTEDVPVDGEDDTWELFEVQESWLAKLGSWSEALSVYDEKLSYNPNDFEAILGSMRCLDATGEWGRVLDLAKRSWFALAGDSTTAEDQAEETVPASFSSMYITPRGRRKALKFCAQAAWRLGQWDELEKYATQLVRGTTNAPKTSKLPTALSRVGERGDRVPVVDFDGAFYTSVLHIHRKEWSMAEEAIDAARAAMDSRFTALMAESYKRAYPSMVTAQTLSEMEEIISFRIIEERFAETAFSHPANRPNKDKARKELLSIWADRLAGCRMDADVHSAILAVRSLVLSPVDNVEGILTLSDLSKQAQRLKLAERVLLDPLRAEGADINGSNFGFGLPDSLALGSIRAQINDPEANASIIDRMVNGEPRNFLPKYGTAHERYSRRLVQEAGGLETLNTQHRLYFAYVKHLWATDKREEAMHRLSRLSDVVDLVSHCEGVGKLDDSLRVACWLELGEWRLDESSTRSTTIPDSLQVDVLGAFRRATSSPSCGYSAWHSWALLNFRIAQQMQNREEDGLTHRHHPKKLGSHVCVAVKGFVNAISSGTRRWSASVLQDMLNLLTCLFQYGELSGVARSISEGMGTITIEAWLGVLPQLLARIHIRTPSVRSVLHPLLVKLGEKHPQALMYPLSVLVKSPVSERRIAAESLMNSLKAHSSSLVDEALMVSSELIRVAILWIEKWHATLDEASRVLYEKGNVAGFLDLLLPLHEEIERGGETRREKEFLRKYGKELAEAHRFAEAYMDTMKQGRLPIPSKGGFDASGEYSEPTDCLSQAETQLNKAWDLYYHVFRRINNQLPPLTKLELSQCSPALNRAHNLELGIPGSYRVDGSYTKIERFVPNMHVITSKQRPRKISLRGSDGKDYIYLLKGHEDLRQDERVMQLFGLVNALLARDRQTKKHDLNIQRFTIVPLSHDCGLVGWVPLSETLHSLVRDYRHSKKIRLNMENYEMLKIAPDYEMLPVMQKVEVFTEALRRCVGGGNDLYEILWLHSTTSEEWLDRRTKYTRSLAVMSIVGYILGLGDRHPSNLMINQQSGRVLHIDFGDCFEVAMNREKFPEKIPFRLTRMLVKAMEVSGIEGSYRSTCERTMLVLRENRDSLVAMLEAFVYDPLISWRLMGLGSHESRSEDLSLPDSDLDIPEAPAQPDQDSVLHDASLASISSNVNVLHESIAEGLDEDAEEPDSAVPLPALTASVSDRVRATHAAQARSMQATEALSSSRARSLRMYSEMQADMAAYRENSRVASVAGEPSAAAAEGSVARSRRARSVQQQEIIKMLEGEHGAARDESLNEKALEVIRRVQDKLSGTDFCDPDDDVREPLDVPDQVGRLIVQATSTENLCQLFIGMCAFW